MENKTTSELNPVQIEACARAAHEVNRAWCIAHGDASQPTWDEAPGWQRESALKGVIGVLAGNGPEQSHESWLAEKERTGWKYGPVKDTEKREHPCFVPYAELPPEQKAKDGLFVGTVRAMAEAFRAHRGGDGGHTYEWALEQARAGHFAYRDAWTERFGKLLPSLGNAGDMTRPGYLVADSMVAEGVRLYVNKAQPYELTDEDRAATDWRGPVRSGSPELEHREQ